eukprot:7347969-Prymnesium_polylepis.4
MAADKGHAGVVRLLLSHRAACHHVQADGLTSLILACRYGHESVVNELVWHSDAMDVDQKGSRRTTALLVAAGNGHGRLVQALIDKGASVDTQRDDGWTALMLASCESSARTRRAPLRPKFPSFWEPLVLAELLLLREHVVVRRADGGHVSAVEQLLNASANLSLLTVKRQTDALQQACRQGHVEVIKALVHAGARVNYARKADGVTALHLACRDGRVQAVSVRPLRFEPRLALHSFLISAVCTPWPTDATAGGRQGVD